MERLCTCITIFVALAAIAALSAVVGLATALILSALEYYFYQGFHGAQRLKFISMLLGSLTGAGIYLLLHLPLG